MAKSKDNPSRRVDSKKSDTQEASAQKSGDDPKNSSGESSKDKQPVKQDSTRETVESIVVAFVLAFLFRGFEAEAFVIPTGSMAPTLYGRHKESDCKQCGFHILIGASDEIDDESGFYSPNKRIETAICPNCRFENDVRDAPVFKGDRILVNKFPYEFSDPQRWDVPVFKYPEKPTTNYIKRLVGLPNETLVIKRGNVYRVEEDRTRTVLRKTPSKQKDIQIPVFDNNFRETALHEKGWPKRWAAVERAASASSVADKKDQLGLGPVAGWTETAGSWQEEAGHGSFAIEKGRATGDSLQWLRYRHIIPSSDDWAAAADGPLQPSDRQYFFDDAESMGPRPQLITDFCGYNTYTGGNGSTTDDAYWVGDLTIVCDLEIIEAGDQPEVVIELNEGVHSYRCRIDTSTGTATLVSVNRFSGAGEREDVLAKSKTEMMGTGSWELRFANVDNRLCLWVDDAVIDFGDAASYVEDESQTPSPQDDDLIPVGIAVRNVSASVSNLVIQRDIYYRASRIDNDDSDRFTWSGDDEHPEPYSLRRVLHDPAEWYQLYSKRARGSNNIPEARFELGPDEYLMLGDNSPRSQDSRVWPNSRGASHRHAVPRSALVGRAFYIYWPHGIPFMNDGEGYPVPKIGYHKELTRKGAVRTDYPDFRVPFYPNFSRMHRIR
ncbi:MAG: signal peptidase I [Planctomycetota bacterium]|nr:signal peptidase I [Planctomycetota bacterium]MDA1164116.1 signal peptidase I [Planctomycetota bacterium]